MRHISRIILSLGVISFLVGVVTQGTFAVLNDSETTSNTFAAGFIDLQIGSECRFKTLASPGSTTCDTGSTFVPTNIGPLNKFFNFGNLEPGDFGATSIAIQSISSDAWGRLKFLNLKNIDNNCTEPELTMEPGCTQDFTTITSGELQSSLLFTLWLDEGATAGFQCLGERRCVLDATEGDNLKQSNEPALTNVLDGSLSHSSFAESQTIKLSDVFKLGTQNDAGGKFADGHMNQDFTYFVGISWELPLSSTNAIQTDSFEADLLFEVQQYHNNVDVFTP
ncbi:MAG TPA: TasA family protein [Patescibacteria group bacterium]|nr:TasA family protein [Patescibacteria group bacterium]